MKPQLLNQYIKFLNQSNSQSGFTLIELLLASFMSIFVVGAAGYGLVAILGASSTAEAKTQRQIELNRALEYIADEVKMSRKITAVSTGTFPGTTKQGLFWLDTTVDLDSSVGTAQDDVVYFVRDSTGIWLKDFVVNRDVGSDYSTTISIPANGDDTLVDALVTPPSTEVTAITSQCTSSSGTFYGNYGFYACIYSGNRKVDLYLYGKTGSKTTDYVKVKTTAFARAQ